MKNPKTNRNIFQFFLKILLCLLFLYVFLSLVSHDLKDGDIYPAQHQIYNWMGKSGAIVSQALYLWLGKIAWFIPLSIALSYRYIGKFNYLYGYWVCWGFFFLLWLCTLASFFQKFCIDSGSILSSGGILGLFLFESLQTFFGKWSAFFLLCVGVVLGLYAFTIILEERYWIKVQDKKE